MRARCKALLMLTGLAPTWVFAAGPPQLDTGGRQAYASYLEASEHKAFAIAPGGVWAWQAELPSPEMAKQAALRDCSSHAGRPCLPYAVDQDVVLDEQAWRQVWRPYLTHAQAERAPRGMKRGQRFPDLRLNDDKGRVLRLSELRGRVVVLHFWGSWCPHCIREMPDLQRLYDRLAGSREVAFVLLPVREAFAQARQWARGRGIRMPLYDGGPEVTRNQAFVLANGDRLADREVARAFPTTYVLDRHGVVVFAHTGPVADWLAYLPQLRDAAAGSGGP